MTTLYRPVLIESAEQAEALPVGTVARSHGSDGEPTHACLRMANGWWCTDETNDDGTPFLVPHAGMVRDTAFVPIEAEEEWTVGQEDPSWAPGTESWARRFQAQEPGRRLFRRSVTPWEEA